MSETILTPLTESMQMYLVTIARLRTDGQPVPLSQLADVLSISSVSVNEMCRKLQDHGLVNYRPYKGATLTQDGERRAFHILRRHRLWEVFLVDKLGFDYDQAHEIACQLEHATPNLLADRLDFFLEYPLVNPQGEPIPRGERAHPARALAPLVTLSAGQRGHVVRCDVSNAARIFLGEQDVRPGVMLTMMAVAGDSILVQVEGTHEEVRLTAIHGGRCMRKRLADLGRNLGVTVRVMPRDGHGPLILGREGLPAGPGARHGPQDYG